jgi:hypothetical protein
MGACEVFGASMGQVSVLAAGINASFHSTDLKACMHACIHRMVVSEFLIHHTQSAATQHFQALYPIPLPPPPTSFRGPANFAFPGETISLLLFGSPGHESS